MNVVKRMCCALSAAALIASHGAMAQDYPNKPIKMIVGFSPGGFTDVLGRLIGQKLQERMGQPVIVENKVGAAGTIGADFVAKSKPDGYTLLMGHVNSNSIAPALYPKLPYDVIRDFTPIVHVASTPLLLTVHPTVPASESPPNTLQHINVGKLKALGITSTKRSPLLPNVPTIAEQGLPGYEMGQWFGVFGPPGMPRELTNRLAGEIIVIIKSPDVVEKINQQGGEVIANGPEKFAAFLPKDTAHWSKLMKDANIKVE